MLVEATPCDTVHSFHLNTYRRACAPVSRRPAFALSRPFPLQVREREMLVGARILPPQTCAPSIPPSPSSPAAGA